MAMRFAFICLAVWVLMQLAGCATKQPQAAPAGPLAVVVQACPAAEDLPEAPARSLALEAEKPGLAVQLFAANRARWIGYADALRGRLEACK